ncbi:MAG: hypothetical protein ACOH12_14270 [Parvibaculaceae bacterium]
MLFEKNAGKINGLPIDVGGPRDDIPANRAFFAGSNCVLLRKLQAASG